MAKSCLIGKYGMRSWITLVEKYLTTIPIETLSVEVFENPSHKELAQLISRGLYGIIRGIIDENGTLRVWSEEEVEHGEIEDAMGFQGVRVFFSKVGMSYYPDDFDVVWPEIPEAERVSWLRAQKTITRVLRPTDQITQA